MSSDSCRNTNPKDLVEDSISVAVGNKEVSRSQSEQGCRDGMIGMGSQTTGIGFQGTARAGKFSSGG